MFDKIKSGFKTFVNNVKTRELTGKNLDQPLDELELALVRNGVALVVAQKIVDTVKEKLLGTRLERTSKIEAFLKDIIKASR